MIKIDYDLNLYKSKVDKGYIKILTLDYNPNATDVATMVIENEEGVKVDMIKSFDYDDNGYFFTINDNLEEGIYNYYIILNSDDDMTEKIFENRRLEIK